MLVAYGRIAYTLWFHSRPGEPTATGQLDSVGAVSKRLDERKRVVRMLVVIVSVFAVSWFPFFSLQVYDPAPHGAERSTALGVSVCLSVVASVCPPVQGETEAIVVLSKSMRIDPNTKESTKTLSS